LRQPHRDHLLEAYIERNTTISINYLSALRYGMSEGWRCSHDKVELIGEQKGEKGVNKYFKCQKCGNVLILSEEGVLYEVPAANR
jgi:hypothetical protein